MTKLEKIRTWLLLYTPLIAGVLYLFELFFLRKPLTISIALLFLSSAIIVFGMIGFITNKYISYPKINLTTLLKIFIQADLKKYYQYFYIRTGFFYRKLMNLGIMLIGLMLLLFSLIYYLRFP
ncbi:MAG: hypothetical protein WCJ58_07120 [bacterium]